MVSTLGRVMSVLLAMCSVAFMSFAISRWATIPDWASEAREMRDFRLNRTEGETPSWSATTRRTEENVATSTNLANVLEKMYQRATQDLQAELREINEEIPLLERDIDRAQQTTQQDSAGVDNRVQELQEVLNQFDSQVVELTTEIEREKAQAQQIQAERERRRADVYRIREDLGQLLEDNFRADQLVNTLTDMIRRLQGSVVKLQTRQQILEKSLESRGNLAPGS